MDNSILTKCDNCNNDFRLTEYLEQKLPNSVIRTYFKCPHCNKDYTCFYTDREIRKLQAKARSLTGTDPKTLAEADKILAKIKEKMNKLKSKFESR